jgi:hypothetical protein
MNYLAKFLQKTIFFYGEFQMISQFKNTRLGVFKLLQPYFALRQSYEGHCFAKVTKRALFQKSYRRSARTA